MDWVLRIEACSRERRRLLVEARGDILEIGFGTGLNLAHYPESVKKLTAIEPNVGMGPLARERIAVSAIEVERRALDGGRLPMADASFDTVVSTWTLCSIAELDRVLDEIRRVLRPEGRFLFLEHGLSDRPVVQKWQRRMTPLQRIVGDGCRLDVKIDEAIARAGFEFETIERRQIDELGKLSGFTYRGAARAGR
jgi:ubiquinone/menaquinone biosynthesis C-methylase UbiE